MNLLQTTPKDQGLETLIIIPTYNEKENLEDLLKKIFALPINLKVLIVDDNSPDGTGDLAEKLARNERRISVLHRDVKQGLGKAYLAGFRYAVEHFSSDYIVGMDADLSHDPQYIPKFLEEIETCDVVIGSRFYKGRISIINRPLSRLIFSCVAQAYVNFFTWLSLGDTTSGFKCFKRAVIEALLKSAVLSDGYAFQIEVNYICKKLGFLVREIPVVFYDRCRGYSKIPAFHTVLEAILIVWKLKFRTFTRRSDTTA
ncbi:MAG TPA: polyprenol monophosphomannose synthase [Candidatus Omnitrophota bacterium]|nr:polyprenol monophosphomannose synthase [Candidatus Omnitrophota bacterium]